MAGRQPNRAQFARLLPAAAGSALALLPEMFATSFTMPEPATCAEGMDGPTVGWLRERLLPYGCAIAGNLAIPSGRRRCNRFLFNAPDGESRRWLRRHTVAMAGEHHGYVAGNARRVDRWQGWRLCPQVCYDLR